LFLFFFVSHHSKQNSAFNLPLTLICLIAMMYRSSSYRYRFSDGHDQMPDHRFAIHGCGNFELWCDGLRYSPMDDRPAYGHLYPLRDGSYVDAHVASADFDARIHGHPSPLRGGSYVVIHVASADFDARIHGFPDANSEVASADFDAPSVAHAVSANFDAPRSGISYLNARLATGHFDAVAIADFDAPSRWLSSSGTLAVSARLDARMYNRSYNHLLSQHDGPISTNSHCTLLHLLGVESLLVKPFLPGWTTTLTIIFLLAVDVLVTKTPLVPLAP
jgi:hypothetical protein